MTIPELIKEIYDFTQTPPGKVITGFATSAGGVVVMWWRSKKAERKAREGAIALKKEEEKDWEMHCNRARTNVDKMDKFCVRIGGKIRNADAHYEEVVRLMDNPTPENITKAQRELTWLEYFFSDMEVEFEAHNQERVKIMLQNEQVVERAVTPIVQQPIPPQQSGGAS